MGRFSLHFFVRRASAWGPYDVFCPKIVKPVFGGRGKPSGALIGEVKK